MDDLEETAARLMAAVRNLPPGPERQDALKEVGRLRSRMYGLLQQAPPLLVSSRPTSCPEVWPDLGSLGAADATCKARLDFA
jgi:hypothetical protein